MSTRQTQRERVSAEASRAKAQAKRRAERNHTLKRVMAVVAVLLVAAVGVAWQTGMVARAHAALIAKIDEASVRGGFALQTIYLDGRSRTPREEMDAALALPKGTPMLTLSLSDVRARLEQLPTIKAASVERELPGTLHIKLTEREPVAIWQYKGKLALLDETGAVMEDLDVAHYTQLPLLIGEGVPEHVKEGLELISSASGVSPRVSHATLIAQRRWDLGLQNGITIKLPVANPQEALQQFSSINQAQQLTERAIKVVDMRDSTRMVIQKSLLPAPPTSPLARET